jgi:1-acyl-sn-glycerol-3-phosphate acyltransferase
MKMITERFLYHFFRYLVSIGLRFYYKDIKVIGLDKFPRDNPIITASNHPTGLMDVFLVLYHVKKQIKFTAAGGLFKNKLQAAFLTSAGAIPLYRRKDTPNEMDKNVESFENCYQELESCGAIGFYPEGTSHPEPWVNQIKTGAARLASFRGSVFVKFGNPISLKKYNDPYRKNSVEAVEQLTAEIQKEMESCTFHIKNNTLLNLIEDIKIIGFDELKLDYQNPNSRAAKYYFITKILEDKIAWNGKKTAITKLNSLANKTSELKQQIQQLGLTGHPFKGIITIVRFFYLFIISLLGLPFALEFGKENSRERYLSNSGSAFNVRISNLFYLLFSSIYFYGNFCKYQHIASDKFILVRWRLSNSLVLGNFKSLYYCIKKNILLAYGQKNDE